MTSGGSGGGGGGGSFVGASSHRTSRPQSGLE